MHILYIAVDELPDNCKECVNTSCRLPLPYYRGYRTEIKEQYLSQRHEDCPLKVARKDIEGLKHFNGGTMRGITVEDDEMLLQTIKAKKYMYIDDDGHVWTKEGKFVADAKEVDVGEGIVYD